MHIPRSVRAARHARMLWCAFIALLFLLAVGCIAPQQLPVILYKASLILLAAFTGYWIDRWAFPYARPDSYLVSDWRRQRGFVPCDANAPIARGYARIFAAALVRRAIIMGAAMLAVGLGL